jgi:hypothetical protein
MMGDVAEGRRNADGLPFPTARHFSAAVSAPMHAAADGLARKVNPFAK